MPLGERPREGRNRGGNPLCAAGRPAGATKKDRADGVFRDRLDAAVPLVPSGPCWRISPPRAPDCDPKDPMTDTKPPCATLAVCITCRRDGISPEDTRPGARMLAALAALALPEGVTLRPVECLSACTHGCSVALQAPGKWTYVYGNLDPAAHAPDILHGAALYAASPDGIVTWRDRPALFRKQSLARVPPLE